MKDHPAITPRAEEIFGATINGVRMSTRQGHTKEKPVSPPPFPIEELKKWIQKSVEKVRDSIEAEIEGIEDTNLDRLERLDWEKEILHMIYDKIHALQYGENAEIKSSTPPLLLEEFEKWLSKKHYLSDLDFVTTCELIEDFRKDSTKS